MRRRLYPFPALNTLLPPFPRGFTRHLFGTGTRPPPGTLSSAIDPVEGHAGTQQTGPRVLAGLVSVRRADLAVAVRRLQAACPDGFAAQDQGEHQAKQQHQSSHEIGSFLRQLSTDGRTQAFLLAYMVMAPLHCISLLYLTAPYTAGAGIRTRQLAPPRAVPTDERSQPAWKCPRHKICSRHRIQSPRPA